MALFLTQFKGVAFDNRILGGHKIDPELLPNLNLF